MKSKIEAARYRAVLKAKKNKGTDELIAEIKHLSESIKEANKRMRALAEACNALNQSNPVR